ncbi:flavin reductase family protein [Aquisediminimonas profunda]|uniref:flavin reductase family protein n=1 Tax=Aquisediminimonas profunda TaxID=1550733 RepID=UPI001C625200|nr:flavin reductase family protein [Aquisediminimonas profunda]
MIEASANLAQYFRTAMRSMASSVHLIMTGENEERAGMTATAVTSLSFDPLSLLVCINRSATIFDVVELSGRFSVNVLSEEDVAIANVFGQSSKRDERFTRGDWSEIGGVPILKSAVSSIVCKQANFLDHGTHRIIIGQVIAVRLNYSARPLLYVDGTFASAKPFSS